MVGGVVVLGAMQVGLWLLARAGVSPEQRVVDAEPPPAAVAHAVLEERVLEDVVTVRGRVVVQEEVSVRGPEPPADGLPVVVDLPIGLGEEVDNGDVISVVADRPVMTLEMPVPLWRALHPDDEGPDVERFQRALSGLGYQVPVDGVFGSVTQQAVRQWYRDRGFEAVEVIVDPSASGPGEEDDGSGAESNGDTSADTGSPESGESDTALGTAELPEPEIGVMVPLGEVVGVQALPALVTGLPTPVGSEAGESPLAVLSPSDSVITADVEPGRAQLLTPGTLGVAEIDSQADTWEVEVVADDGQSVDGRLAAGQSEDGQSTDGDLGSSDDPVGGQEGRRIVFAPTVPFTSDLVGSSVRVEVTLDSTEGAVLAAPIASVRTDTNGEYLQVRGEAGEAERVSITPGRSIGGWVELVDPAGLEPGLTVLVN